MPLGPGKYDDLCTEARVKADAKAALLIIVGGRKGSGFSAQMPPEALYSVPKMLREVAQQIEDATKGES